MICGGDSTEYCGGSNRLELYSTTASQPLPTATLAPKPTVSSWNKYVKDFQLYMSHWDRFNDQVVDHFKARRETHHNDRKEEAEHGQRAYGWLETFGETGAQNYLNELQQDNEVRKKWALACDEHEKRVLEYMAFRQKMT